MGRICPILNHPLNDGVLVNDDALVSFIQKRNVDFLAHEYVCRSCKHEVEKLYRKKLKKATELHRSRYHDGSVSTLKTSKDSSSSGASATSEGSVTLSASQTKRVVAEEGSKDNIISQSSLSQQNVNEKTNEGRTNNAMSADVIAVSETSVEILTTYSNEKSILQENQQNLANIPQNSKNVTIRKRTIKDFYTPRPQKIQTVYQTVIHADGDFGLNNNDDDVIRRYSQEPTTSKAAADSNMNSVKQPIAQYTAKTASKTASTDKNLTRHVTGDMDLNSEDDDNRVIRRLSEEPTTSGAAAATKSNKRPISAIIDHEDDDDRALSLNAYNGTRLPHIQPVPPKRKSLPDKPSSIGRDIMDNYIKDITGG